MIMTDNLAMIFAFQCPGRWAPSLSAIKVGDAGEGVEDETEHDDVILEERLEEKHLQRGICLTRTCLISHDLRPQTAGETQQSAGMNDAKSDERVKRLRYARYQDTQIGVSSDLATAMDRCAHSSQSWVHFRTLAKHLELSLWCEGQFLAAGTCTLFAFTFAILALLLPVGRARLLGHFCAGSTSLPELLNLFHGRN